MLRAHHGMKSDEKLFSVNFFREKRVHAVINRYFSLFLKGFEFFS